MPHWIPAAIRVIAWTGSITSAIYAGLVIFASECFRKRRMATAGCPADFAPALSVLKPLHGAEPGLQENLRSFFTQQYAGMYELCFCARHENDAGLAIARALSQEFPGVRSRIMTCGEPQFPNPKVYSLAVMAEAASADTLITSDADARIASGYMSRFVQELREKTVDAAFSLYLAQPVTARWFLYLDALGKSVEMNAGVLVADMLAGTDFTLGVSVIQRREVFSAVGGFAELGTFWAEDFVLGNRLAEQGRGVRISTETIQLMVSGSAKHSFRNQLRWAQSTRRSRRLGHLGTGLTFAAPFALLGCFLELATGRPMEALLFLAVAWAQRALLAGSVLRALGSTAVLRDACAYLLRDLYGFAIWLGSYLPADTSYHGTHFRIMPDGSLRHTSSD